MKKLFFYTGLIFNYSLKGLLLRSHFSNCKHPIFILSILRHNCVLACILTDLYLQKMVGRARIELATSSMSTKHSTSELTSLISILGLYYFILPSYKAFYKIKRKQLIMKKNNIYKINHYS